MRPQTLLFTAILLFVLPVFGQSDAALTTVAEVNGERISLQDLQQASGEQLALIEDQAYSLKQQKLQQMIGERLLAAEAARRKVSVGALVETEVNSKAAAVTAEEIHTIYELNKNQLQKPEADVTDQIRTLLRDQKIAVRRAEFVKSLQSQAKVTILLVPPPPFRSDVGLEGPSRGAADAPVTIVEFEDFQCPFCKKAQGVLDQVLLRYKDKVRVVHRDFPLQPLHPASEKAHEAARCAEEQGKFWEYRDLLYKNTPAAGPEQLNDYAARVGADLTTFQQCLDSGKFKALGKRMSLTASVWG